MTWPWPNTSPNSRRTGLRTERAPRTHQQRPPRRTGHAGAQGPARSGWKGLVPINFRIATDRPHIPVVQPHSPTWIRWGTDVQPPSARRLGRGNAHRSSPPPPGFQPGHYTPLTRGRGAGRGRARGGRAGAGRGRSGGGGGRPMCTLCTNAGKPATHPLAACPFTTCHKCGQPGHIQRHCPN